MLRTKVFVIITCKGTKSKNKIKKCSFMYEGSWGDEDIVSHQKLHESNENETVFWLGFDTSLPFGKYSGRDGKKN